MSDLYKALSDLCAQKGISGYRMCKDLGIQPSVMTDLKMGRRSGLRAETAAKIAAYFNVTVDYLLGMEPSAPKGPVTDDDIKFALFNGDRDISDEAFQEVKDFAAYVHQKYKKGKE